MSTTSNDIITTGQTPKEKLDAATAALGLTIEASFVPFSQSRNKTSKHRSLNWKVTLKHNGRPILIFDYASGIGHAPAMKAKTTSYYTSTRATRETLANRECECGRALRYDSNGLGRKIEPNTTEIIYSLVQDTSVIDAGGFSNWAHDYDYNDDSISAKAIYDQCVEHALALRSAIGEAGLATLRDATQDY